MSRVSHHAFGQTDKNEKVMSEVPIIPMSAIYTILKEQCENGSFYI